MVSIKKKENPNPGFERELSYLSISLSHHYTTTPTRQNSEKFIISTYQGQRAKKVVSDSPGVGEGA